MVATYGNTVAETTIERGGPERVDLILDSAEAPVALKLDLLFMLDTTGSMGDELNRMQQTIDSIAQRIDAFTPRPQIRYGLVAFRDHGDDYVTITSDFVDDLSTFRRDLNALYADGGGDIPEAVEEALYDGITRVRWSDAAVRLIFLVGDAAPHIDPQSQYTYLDATTDALGRGVKIYPIAASNTDPQAEYVFRQLAQQTLASFVFLTYQEGANGGVPGESTVLEAGEQSYSVDASTIGSSPSLSVNSPLLSAHSRSPLDSSRSFYAQWQLRRHYA
ncbi:VWA domain-containing protein [Candidatus Gracilibacteria bacterium]|nr:VWA domain-containing protein [Candidatus Gracilibacteria bacterium]